MRHPAIDKALYQQHRDQIEAALAGSTGMLEFVSVANRRDVFYMLTFCLSVPGGFANRARVGVEHLKERGLYEAELPVETIAEVLKPYARFHNVKAARIAKMRKEFDSIFDNLVLAQGEFRRVLAPIQYLRGLRERLRLQVDGLSWKQASHFLRNIGMRGLVIVDIHVLKAFYKRGFRKDIKPPKTQRDYESMEDQMLFYADTAGLTIDQLDFLWRLQGNPNALLR